MRQLDSVFMTSAEFQKALGERVIPVLQEMGVDGFVAAGYISDGEGKMGRFAICHVNKNPAIEDGLRNLATFASMWSGPAKEFGPPPPDKPA